MDQVIESYNQDVGFFPDLVFSVTGIWKPKAQSVLCLFFFSD